MADFGSFLPLSQRSSGSESDVSSDRRAAVADVVEQAAQRVTAAALSGERRDTAALIEAFIDAAQLRAEAAAHPGGSPGALDAVAAAVRTGKRRSVRALASACRALLQLAEAVDAPVELPPDIAGAVALYLAGAGPFDRRAAVKGHTVRATDADWSFGRGPLLEAPATQIAAFLLGTSDEPPRPPRVTGG
ncbi:hypothetical protein [Microbacterium sp. P05]|uniref:hypothetical protein n=1 Tax=Microbacterium sp. P05 TaxID=3366948 RepID=UPI003744DCD5